ncbi:hypothetical protein Bcav_0210 [Beutenbergia cavernae DSM 12333]|uniref:Uncharacterized protein n=1 Tax=Beutenbergia cavernae (strain ATCC BAA-8 / DSM 12333 / CCUG 43141 / JCM 11478 / NBRC 16432 / NCIMB 13614 / HKI 0122) TaxID=471853 RepID=C5BVN5_BEUC1|nr:hypothetical protein [Beutenbergia cavernae]ACQ78475.1 hypothetical protein Bcav_0210 [Beutenbergia cavernae DSM 12333]
MPTEPAPATGSASTTGSVSTTGSPSTPASTVRPGDLVTAPAGMRHRPVADDGLANALHIETPWTKQYGEEGAPA